VRCTGGLHASLHLDGSKGVISCQRNTSPPIAFRRFTVATGWADPTNVPVPLSAGGFDVGDSHWVHYSYGNVIVVSWDRRDAWIFSAFDAANVDRTLLIPPPYGARYGAPMSTNPTVFNNIHVRHLDNFYGLNAPADTRRVFGPIRVTTAATAHGNHEWEFALSVANGIATPAEQASVQMRLSAPGSFTTCVFDREPLITVTGECRYIASTYIRLKDTN
jgi:hypothetical protein